MDVISRLKPSAVKLIFPPHCMPRQHKTQTNVRLLARAVSAGRRLFGHEQHRFASAFVPRKADMGHQAATSSPFMDTQRPKKARHNIREHLKQWKVAGDSASRTVPSLDGSSWSPSPRTMNAMSQSGQNDAIYMNVEPGDDSEEASQFHTAYAQNVTDAVMPQVFLRPGDLVDVNTHSTSFIAIVVRAVPGIVFLYTERGTWHRTHVMNIQFSVPNVMSAQELSGLLPYVTAFIEENGVMDIYQPMPITPRDVGEALVAKMARFLRESDAVFRKYANRMARAYEILSQDEPGGYTTISLEDAAKRLLEKQDASDLTPTMFFIVHRTLKRSQNIIPTNIYHHYYPWFMLLPQLSLTRLESVREWVREFQKEKMRTSVEPFTRGNSSKLSASVNPIAKFAAKARRVIAYSRQNRPLSSFGTLGPSLAPEKLRKKGLAKSSAYRKCQESFDQDEQHIIGFLAAWSLSRSFNKASNLESLGPTILRATEMYQGNLPLDQFVGCTMLQEMGIVKPWERDKLFDNLLQLPGNDMRDPATILLNQANRSISDISFPLKDSMSEYRKSLGVSRVLCIDGQGTQEVDDGISLESIDGDEDLCWIHVHIANPSAFLTNDSPVARYARHISSSIYFPDETYPMMEPALSRENFSLANGRPCITFSAKVSAEGEVVEKHVSHGILGDVHHISLQSVNQTLQHHNIKTVTKGVSSLRVGADLPPLELDESSPEMLGNAADIDGINTDLLRKLHKISKALHRRRLRNGALPLGHTIEGKVSPKVSLPSSLLESISSEGGRVPAINAQESRHFVSDPVISIGTQSADLGEAINMITEFMLLAGQICAMWCSERNIPILYRGVIRNPDLSAEPEVLNLPDEAHPLYWRKFWGLQTLYGNSHCSASPLEHSLLGLPVYCKATSPLRRYGDLFNHWQIEAAIRHEHSSGKSLVGGSPDLLGNTTVLTFSYREVDKVARSLFTREKQMNAYQRNADRYWTLQALYRAFHFQEAVLPAQFEVSVHTVKEDCRQSSSGFLVGWNLTGVLDQTAASDQEGGFRVDDIWEARLVRVHPLKFDVNLEPLRLIYRSEGST